MPAVRADGAGRHLLLISSAGIGLLFGAGFLYERDTHLTIAEFLVPMLTRGNKKRSA